MEPVQVTSVYAFVVFVENAIQMNVSIILISVEFFIFVFLMIY